MDDFLTFLIIWFVLVVCVVGIAAESESDKLCNYVAADNAILLFNCDSN